jgi:hypothetical protein
MQPSPPVRAGFRRSRTSAQCDVWRPSTVSGTRKVLPVKRTMRSVATAAPGRHIVGSRPAGARPGPARERPSCSLTMTGHTALHRAWTRRPESRRRPCPPRPGRHGSPVGTRQPAGAHWRRGR